MNDQKLVNRGLLLMFGCLLLSAAGHFWLGEVVEQVGAWGCLAVFVLVFLRPIPGK